MTRLFLECAIRAALIVAGTAIVLYVLRVNAARIKHRVWTAVVLLMLLLPLWTAWGPKAPVRILPPLTTGTANYAIAPTSAIPPFAPHPDTALEISEPATRPPVSKLQALLLGIYLLGLFSFLARLALGTAEARKLVQQAVLRNGRRTSAACASPVTVGWLHPTVILPEGWQQWPQAQLDAVSTHECEHVRRRDPLVQWLALLNRAVFWFHPVAWWLERELSSLAEEACDNAVLARGYDARDYAETLMDLARAVMRSGARVNLVGVAMPDASLPQRIRHIIENVPAPRISRTRIACLVATCAITCAAFAAGRLDRAQAPTTQSASPAPELPAFDAASIKPNKSGDQGLRISLQRGGHFTATNVSLRILITHAYQLSFGQGRSAVIGGPAWMDSDHFDVETHAAGDPSRQQVALMEQSLLASRFKLVMHHETRNDPVYALVMVKPGKTGLQLQLHAEDGSTCHDAGLPPTPTAPGVTPAPAAPPCGGGFVVYGPHLVAESTMEGLAKNLSWFGQIDRAVVDRTGLTGTYDMTLDYNNALSATAGASDGSSLPSVFTALREQLGLKLESQTGPVDVLVIDHVEQLSPN